MNNVKTITELYYYVKDVLLKTENLNDVYIGKTESGESAQKRHERSYQNTKVIACGEPKNNK